MTRSGGWKRPNSGWSPPLELKWFATANTVSPRQRNSPASGLRLVVNAGFGGSSRPGLNVSSGPDGPSTTSVAFVGVPPGRSTKASPRSVRNRKPTRMLPPGWPPSWSSTGSIWRNA